MGLIRAVFVMGTAAAAPDAVRMLQAGNGWAIAVVTGWLFVGGIILADEVAAKRYPANVGARPER